MYNKLKEIKKKRYLLLLIPIEIILLIFVNGLYNENYMRYFMLNMSFILFYNFTDLLISLHKKPIYYDDLIVKNNNINMNEVVIDKYKIYYQNIFKWSNLITSPILCALLTDIWFIKTTFINNNEKTDIKYFNPSTAAAIAIIFSLSSLYIKISIYFGKFLITFLKLLKNHKLKKEEKKRNIKIIELNKSSSIILKRNSKSYNDIIKMDYQNPLNKVNLDNK